MQIKLDNATYGIVKNELRSIIAKAKKVRVIEIPKWACIGNYVRVKDKFNVRGDEHAWYREKIVGLSTYGVFHKASGCPVYHTPFSEYGKTIKEEKF